MSEIRIVTLNQTGEEPLFGPEDGDEITAGMTCEEALAWEAEMHRLKMLNFGCMVWHLAQGSLMLYLSIVRDDQREWCLPMTTLFTTWDNDYPEQVFEYVGEFVMLRMCSAFCLLSALAHALTFVLPQRYERDLRKGMNRFRWYEYAVSSSLMIVITFWAWGNLDFVQISGCFVVNMLMCLFGDLHEVMNSGKRAEDVDWTAFRYGMFAGLVPWVILLFEVVRFIILYWGYLNYVPSVFWALLATYQFLFNTFPINMYCQYRQRGKYNNDRYPLLPNGGYLKGERCYQWLSLVAKTLIIWQIALVAWMPEDTYDNWQASIVISNAGR